MSASLKSYIPRLSQIAGLSPSALYERQRALVREGLLSAEEGRGPGSGVRATPEAVAVLLIAILATDSLSETGPKTVEMACAASEKEPSKWMTGRSFANALAEILTSNELVEHRE